MSPANLTAFPYQIPTSLSVGSIETILSLQQEVSYAMGFLGPEKTSTGSTSLSEATFSERGL